MRVFFCDDDYEIYRRLLREQVSRYKVSVWDYCLMPNHLHLIAVPSDPCGLARAFAATHRRYALLMNDRHGWRGHLWQERFWSFPMSDAALPAVTRYVLLNPVRASLVDRAQAWPFSSARQRLGLCQDNLADGKVLHSRIGDWESLLDAADDAEELAAVRKHSATGRPLGDDHYVAEIEALLGRTLMPRPPGRPRKRF
jgi:putative transposase